MPSENVFFLANWLYPFAVILSFILLLIPKINSGTCYYENIHPLIELPVKDLHSVKPCIHLILV